MSPTHVSNMNKLYQVNTSIVRAVLIAPTKVVFSLYGNSHCLILSTGTEVDVIKVIPSVERCFISCKETRGNVSLVPINKLRIL